VTDYKENIRNEMERGDKDYYYTMKGKIYYSDRISKTGM
jgi:hypothetical protein